MKKRLLMPLLIIGAIAVSGWTWYASMQGPPEQPIQLAASNSLSVKKSH